MIAVLDTGLSNSASVLFALERLGYTGELTSDPDRLIQSQKVIFPGVGAASAWMEYIQQKELLHCLREVTAPLLGICLGMQVFYETSEEGAVTCLGFLSGTVRKMKIQPNLPIPHLGWNTVQQIAPSLLLKGIADQSYFYFVHSFHAPLGSETLAVTEYGNSIPAVIEYKNLFGTQFHPEKSGKLGAKLLKNFMKL